MWFEADAIIPYATDRSFLEQPDFQTLALFPDAQSEFLVDRAGFARGDYSAEPRSAIDWTEFGGLFASTSLNSIELGEGYSGKYGTRVMNDEDIVVTGKRIIRLDFVNWWGAGPGDLYWTIHADGGGGGAFDFPPPDEEAIDVQINFDRPLTESESEALDDFLATIEALTVAINALADDAQVRLPNGAYIDGATLKARWADTDFIINDNMLYENGTRGGEARMLGGEPTISFNIQYLDSYNNLEGGMNLVAHDFAHLTQWGTPYYYDQLTANDIARELLVSSGLPYLSNPEFGYSTALPFGFSTPSGTGDDGDGGGGGGAGGNGDYIP